jgi:hypothetical protein
VGVGVGVGDPWIESRGEWESDFSRGFLFCVLVLGKMGGNVNPSSSPLS